MFLTCRIKQQEVMIRMAYSRGSGPTSFFPASRSEVWLWLWIWLWVDAVGQFGLSKKENRRFNSEVTLFMAPYARMTFTEN